MSRTPRRTATILASVITLSVVAAAAASASPGNGATSPDGRRGPAPVYGTDQPGRIPDSYVVVFNQKTAPDKVKAEASRSRGNGAKIRHEYAKSLKGFAGTMSGKEVDRLRRHADVAFLAADLTVAITDTQSPTPSWGLDRIDQRTLPLSSSYTYGANGAGVNAYIIDTGIRTTHSDFGGQATVGTDTVGDGRNGQDCNGHGTHVAGTVGGNTYGVAKNVSLVAVRVLNCSGSGSTSGVIAGVDWVTANAVKPAVANMSLGGGASTALDTAVRNSIASGVTFALAAGNDNSNACNTSPARTAEAITVGATTSTDARASYSNYGTCLDLFAPGSSITAAWSTSDTATNTISGTSMATPHVAGVAALYLQNNPTATPATVRDVIVNSATTGSVTNPGSGSANRLLYSNLGETTPPPPPPPPPAPCAGGTTYSASLSGTGDADIHPNGTYYYSSVAGTHKACLSGPAGTDFDLYLYRWNGNSWSQVAAALGTTSTETITYNGQAGYYYWRVYSYTGAGSYTLTTFKP